MRTNDIEQILNWLSPGSAPHRKGKAIEQLENLISLREHNARTDEVFRAKDLLGYTGLNYFEDRINQLKKEINKE